MDRNSKAVTDSSRSVQSRENIIELEDFRGSDEEMDLKEIEGDTKKETRLEQNEIPKIHSQIASRNRRKTPYGAIFKGQIREVGDGSIEWKDKDQWGKFEPFQHNYSIPLIHV